MLKLKLQYFGRQLMQELTHWKRPWCWGRLKAGGEGTKEDEMVGWHHQLNGQVIDSLGKLWEQGGIPRQHIKNQRHHFANKGPHSQSYGFSSSHVWMWELDHKESLAPKNWCFWTVVLEKTLESPLDCKEVKPIHSKGNQSWIFIERTDVEAPILWPPDVKNWLIGKDTDAGKNWGREEKRTKRMRWLDGITNLLNMSLS